MRPGEQVALIESARNNNGKVSRFESKVAPGSTVPTHYHMAFEEHFEVIEGELTVWIDNRKVVLTAGQKFEIKKNVKHRWKNESKTETRFIGSVIPGNIAFESLLPLFAGLKKDGQLGKNGMPRSMAVLAYMCMISDLRFTGGMSVMWPIMRWVYSRSEKKGVFKKLIEKYSN